MSRYTQAQLRMMAQTVLEAQKMGDDRYLPLVMLLVARTHMNPIQIKQAIERLAKS